MRSLTDAQLETFVTAVVERRFRDRFTRWRATGTWLGRREETLVSEIARAGDAEAARLVAEIGAESERRFGQMAVVRMTLPARLAHISASPAAEAGR